MIFIKRRAGINQLAFLLLSRKEAGILYHTKMRQIRKKDFLILLNHIFSIILKFISSVLFGLRGLLWNELYFWEVGNIKFGFLNSLLGHKINEYFLVFNYRKYLWSIIY